jgi:tetratricopeptide (TPR) repeat protein
VAWSSALAVFAGHWSRRDPAVALVIARAAVRLQPSAKALGNLAALEVETAPELALAHCRQALQILPDYVRVHRTCARAAVRAGKADLAREHALAALPTLSDAKARAAWLTGLRQEASPLLRQALPTP